MRRSEVNKIISYAINVANDSMFPLPPFAYYSPDDWSKIGREQEELVENMLGWDVTDFGSGDFEKIGLTIFTFRNGNFHNQKKYPKIYAEKYLLVKDGQVLPYHYHWYKMEDIINRGGGDLRITLYNATPEDYANHEAYDQGIKGAFDTTPVITKIDGCTITVPAGDSVTLKPGQSITLMPGQYHKWQGVPGTGDVILFEVSTRNDDLIDNRFYEAGHRIPTIEENVEPEYLLFSDYSHYVHF